MRILLVALSGEVGGAEKILRYCAYYHKSKGYQCDIIIFGKKSSSYWDGFNVKYFDGLNLNSFLNFVNIIKNNNYFLASSSLILANSMLGLLRFIGILKCENLIIRESTQVFRRFNLIKLISSYFLYFFYLMSDIIIFQTDEMMSDVLKYCPFLKRKNSVVKHNPLDTSILDKLVNKNNIFNFPYVFTAGRLVNVKGYDLLIKAFSLSDVNLTHKLVISGDGPEKENLNTLVQKLKLSNKVVFTGFKENIYPLIKNADLCIISSRIEGFPNILNEMIYLNDKVLSSYCTDSISKIEFILKSDIYNLKEFSKAIENGIFFNLNQSEKKSKAKYEEKLRINDYFDTWIE